MDIESVRALKTEIATRIVPRAVHAILASGGFSITTLSLAKARAGAEPELALGVAPGRSRNDVKLAVRLQRRSLQSSKLIETIRERSRNEVDIRFVGRIDRQRLPWYRSRVRPLIAGASVGHYKITAGTIGALAIDRGSGRLVILSNNHVLANENDARTGDAVLQPAAHDGGQRPEDVVARLAKFVKLNPRATNEVDAATAFLARSIDCDPLNYRGIGKLAGTKLDGLLPGAPVKKVGRTTGVTHGRVTAIEVDNVVVTYDIGTLSFDDQIEIESTGRGAFSSGGDSGSLILDDENLGCGLLFAGSETGGRNGRGLTYANPIGVVLRKLAIQLAIP
jgi:hypothetical protein